MSADFSGRAVHVAGGTGGLGRALPFERRRARDSWRIDSTLDAAARSNKEAGSGSPGLSAGSSPQYAIPCGKA